jgi:hypothetical protein
MPAKIDPNTYCSTLPRERRELASRIQWVENLRDLYEARLSLSLPSLPCPHCEASMLEIDHCIVCGWYYVKPDLTATIDDHHHMETRTYGVYYCEYEACGIECVKHAPNEMFCHDHSDKHRKVERQKMAVRTHSGSRKVKL